jgi:hypothetical protein
MCLKRLRFIRFNVAVGYSAASHSLLGFVARYFSGEPIV